MKEEDKELLLQDLCARLPYGIIGLYSWKNREPYNRELTGNLYDELKSSWNSTEDSKFLPFLRPMSSMTEEEKKEYNIFFEEYAPDDRWPYITKNFVEEDLVSELIDWLNKKMFDFRGLIPIGAAIEVTENNNPYKE